MTPRNPDTPKPAETLKGAFTIKGTVQLTAAETKKPDLQVRAYVFSPAGELLGSTDVDTKGAFSVSLSRKEIADTELVIGPADDPAAIRSPAAYKRRVSVQDWKATTAGQYVFSQEITISEAIWTN